MSLIVLALMSVFNSTQAAFRASLTQTDVLEGGRSAMGLIKADLESMAPSFGQSNLMANGGYYNLMVSNAAVNFCVITNQYQYSSNAAPLVQSLVGSINPNTQRTNVLENSSCLRARTPRGPASVILWTPPRRATSTRFTVFP